MLVRQSSSTTQRSNFNPSIAHQHYSRSEAVLPRREAPNGSISATWVPAALTSAMTITAHSELPPIVFTSGPAS